MLSFITPDNFVILIFTSVKLSAFVCCHRQSFKVIPGIYANLVKSKISLRNFLGPLFFLIAAQKTLVEDLKVLTSVFVPFIRISHSFIENIFKF